LQAAAPAAIGVPPAAGFRRLQREMHGAAGREAAQIAANAMHRRKMRCLKRLAKDDTAGPTGTELAMQGPSAAPTGGRTGTQN
jgi:hypothetical protein